MADSASAVAGKSAKQARKYWAKNQKSAAERRLDRALTPKTRGKAANEQKTRQAASARLLRETGVPF